MASNRLTDKTCSREGCDNRISAANKTGVCTPCQQGRRPGARSSKPASPRPARASKRRDADDAVLDRVGMNETVVETVDAAHRALAAPAAEAPPTPPGEKTWFDKYCELHAALGLDANQAIEDHCQAWVELTTSRALGEHAVSPPVPARPKRARKSRTNGAAPLASIGDDYEKARAQAESAHEQ